MGKDFSRLVEVAQLFMGQVIGLTMVTTWCMGASDFIDANMGWGLDQRWREGEEGNSTIYSINYICFCFIVTDSMTQKLY